MKKALIIIFLTVSLYGGLYAAWIYAQDEVRATVISTNYQELRRNFLDQASRQNRTVFSHLLAEKGPSGEELAIDVLWIGESNPKRVFLHISGTHGVEGYAGSAIQTELLKGEISPPTGSAIVFLHALNPWGMAHGRRGNEGNVDLNRNFLLDDQKYEGAPDAYRKVQSFLNPKEAPTRIDLFFPEIAYQILRHGFTLLKQAIAGGQYEYPKGIYYGGHELQPSSIFLRDFLRERLDGVQELYVLEVHTGLGEFGTDLLFWPLAPSDEKTKLLQTRLEETLDSDDPTEGAGFRTPGDLQNELPKILPQTEVYWILQEFGTFGPIRMLRALRNENAYHHHGSDYSQTHWSKRELVDVFSPASEQWQKRVLDRGVSLAKKFFSLLEAPLISRLRLKVDGLVCEACALTLHDAFKKHIAVTHVSADPGTKEVVLSFVAGQANALSEEKIARIISSAGYTLVEVTDGDGV
ncbi:DUF2817 domain-containing protein [bacterium]|nr:DUF2817 domain-containing protein [bacterium]